MVTCVVPGATTSLRLAAGRHDNDPLQDLAAMQTSAGSGLPPAVYWLRNEGGSDFSVVLVGSVPAGTAGKILVIGAADGGRDALAAKTSEGSTGRAFAWAPTPAGGGYTSVLDGGSYDDLTEAKLPGWTAAGLVATRFANSLSSLTTFRDVSEGSQVSLQYTQTGTSNGWQAVVAWRDWVMVATNPAASTQSVTFPSDGGREVSSGQINGSWIVAREVDLNDDGDTELFMYRPNPSQYSIYSLPAATAPPPGSSQTLRRVDGGVVTPGNTFAVGRYGASPLGNLFVASDGGAVRRYTNFQKLAASWLVDEADFDAGAGTVMVQVLLADMNNDAKIDLVFVDQLGVIRIHFN